MNVVVIDDSPIVLTRLKILIRELGGCNAFLFAAGLEALAWCQTNDADLVVVDYHLPDTEGLRLIEQLRRTREHIHVPVIMVTQNHDRGVRHLALQMGINDFLTKPFDQAELQARVRNMLALRRHHKRLTVRAESLADEVQRATDNLRAREQETLACFARAAEHRDPETHEHILRMSYYSELIARALRLPAAECELIREAARLHDIGKIGTPDHILLKVGAFTPAEAEVMKAHTTMGHAILAGSRSPILRAGADIALCHHERYDGSGYPRAIAADAIPLHSRIVAVADVFDALTTLRRYKGAWDVERAGRYIREGSGSQFDPACVDAFLASWPEVLVIKARYSEITPPPGVTAEMPVHTLAVTELPAPSLRS